MEDRLFFDEHAGSPLGGLGADAALERRSARRRAGARATDHGERGIALVGRVAADGGPASPGWL
jgi:hypothetical protein